jgi:stage II sporulation protein E
VIMGFLLGRATILGELSPFAIAYFAVIFYLRKDFIHLVGAALVGGSLLSTSWHAGIVVTEILVFIIIYRILEKMGRVSLSFAPLQVAASVFLVHGLGALFGGGLSGYAFLLIIVDSGLSMILTLIFIQAVPVITLIRKKYRLRQEELICLIILLASVMTGTVGWMIAGMSLEHILSRYLILLFAFVGGAPIGASVGVITGLILSLSDMNAVYQMSLLSFAGMLAGLMREGGRFALVFGMLVGSSILSLYIGDPSTILTSSLETIAAISLFLMTPRSMIETLAKFVPGTQENMMTHYDYAKRVRDITASRVQQFSEVFRQLSSSFKQLTIGGSRREAKVSHFMNAVAEKTCAACFRREQCWNEKFYGTYTFMTELMTSIEEKEHFSKYDIVPDWRKACFKIDTVVDVMKQQFQLYKNDQQWRKRLSESRQLVADQLSGVTQVMEDLAKEIQREGQALFHQEEQIRQAIESLGLSVQTVEVISLEEGNVEIELIHRYPRGFDECRKIIAPLLSDIIGETITVKKETYISQSDESTVTFSSAKEFEVQTGVAGAAKGGDLLSGDSFSTVELGSGKFAVALSDGMGNGERARAESSTALTLLQQLLQSGMNEQLAIKSVNSVLMLRSSDEMYATVDMAIIDLFNGHTTFMKIGSTPSYIKRGKEVIEVTANNLPIGILQDIEVDLIGSQLQSGDLLIMMTDGVYDAPGYAVNKDLWMKRVVQEIGAEDPQEFADCLLERIVRHQHGDIQDDMTVMVTRIDRFVPEWGTFHWRGLGEVEQPKTVS